MPPWSNLVDLLDVAPAKSCCSTSATCSPRLAASHAQAAPMTPPPMTSRSKTRVPARADLEDERVQVAGVAGVRRITSPIIRIVPVPRV